MQRGFPIKAFWQHRNLLGEAKGLGSGADLALRHYADVGPGRLDFGIYVSFGQTF